MVATLKIGVDAADTERMRRGTALLTTALLVGACGTSTGEAAPASEDLAIVAPTSTTPTIPTLLGSATSTAPTTITPASPGLGTSTTLASSPSAPTSTPSTAPPGDPGRTTTTTEASATTTPGTRPEEPIPRVTTEPPEPPLTAPESAQEWSEHPLAAGVLDASDLGGSWDRTDVAVVEATVSGDDEDICGLESPATPAGLEASYDHGDLRSAQLVVGSGPESPAMVDAFRSAIDCGFGGELGPGAVITELDTTALAADDAVGARIDLGDDGLGLSMTFLIARWGETLVAVSTGSFGGEPPVSDAEVLELVSLARDRLADAGALS